MTTLTRAIVPHPGDRAAPASPDHEAWSMIVPERRARQPAWDYWNEASSMEKPSVPAAVST
jgi:hypothetical protein